MGHTVSGNTINYTSDIAAGLPVVLQNGTNTYVYGLDLISATDSGGAQTYFLYDGLGSTTALADGAGNTAATYSYDVFGAIRSQTGSSSNYWQFTGEQRDSDSSLYYLRARYYDPTTGRLLSQDPMRAGHAYAYVSNNPANFVDPSGMCIFGIQCDPGDWACTLAAPACEVGDWAAGQLPADCNAKDIGQGYGGRTGCQLAATCAVPKNFQECLRAREIRQDATEFGNLLFPCDDLSQGDHRCEQGTIGLRPDRRDRNDKFRHCFGSGMMTNAFGAGLAEKLTTRYEAHRNNDRFQRAYDIANNRLGREFAQSISGDPGFEGGVPELL